MKRLGKVLGNVLALVLTVFSLQVMAETNMAGRDFNHMSTGFPLTGVHLITACETCHVAGVFKGTARNCDGCHALGKRVVATPKTTSHIVTDAPCDTCHFNASTFLGAKYNHGTAQTGQCLTCHNGRLSTARPASHNSNINKATKSCDQCHRSYAWIPATWNHVGVTPGTCANSSCHFPGANIYYRGDGKHNHTGWQLSDPACDDCHNYFAWSPAPYKHNTPLPCANCHDGVTATGKSSTHGNTSNLCNTCHVNTVSWLGATYHNGAVAGICGTCHNGTNGVKGTTNDPNGMHISLTAGGNPNCDLCHTSTTTFTVYKMNHSGNTTCKTCHDTTSSFVVTTKRQLGNHQGSTAAQDCSGCHSTTVSWLGASNHTGNITGICGQCHTGVAGVVGKPAVHIPSTGNNCDSCHTSTTSFATWTMNHSGIPSNACNPCHATPAPYGLHTVRTIGSHKSSKIGDDCKKCHNKGISWSD